MPFDIEGFEQTRFESRKGTVSVPSLSRFFPEGEEPVFNVRGLTAEEIYQAKSEARKGQLMGEIVGKLASGSSKDQASAVLEALGMSDDVPAELIQIYAHVTTGCVEPKLTRQQVVKMARAFPIEIAQLGQKILELSGKGGIEEVKP